MKLEDKNNNRDPVAKRRHLTENNSPTSVHLSGSHGRTDRSKRSLNLKYNSNSSNRKRNFSTKLSKSLLESSKQLNHLVSHSMSPQQQHTLPLSRTSKVNRNKSFEFRLRKSVTQTVDDNLENNRPFSSVKQKKKQNLNPTLKRLTLNEKSFNSLMINCFDETSNNSQGNSDYSVETSISSASSDGLNTYSLNFPSVEIQNKVLKLKDKVQDLTVTEISVSESHTTDKTLKSQEKEHSTINNINEQVVVPNFRIKIIKMGFRIEGTENINDDIYEKKHQKLENEEIRIQKWDMKRQQNEYEKSKALLKENRPSKAPSTAAQPVMSTFASAKSSPIKRFNANLLSNPHPLNSTSDNVFPLVEDNDMYIIEILDDDKTRRTVETQVIKTPTQQNDDVLEKKFLKKLVTPGETMLSSSVVVERGRDSRTKKMKKPHLLISVKGFSRKNKLSKSKRRLNSNTTPITSSSSSQVKHTSETAHTELEQIKSEPKRKRRRLT